MIQLTHLETNTSPRKAPESPQAAQLVQKGIESMQRRDVVAAREALGQAESFSPQQAGLWVGYAMLFFAQNQPEKGFEALQKEISYHPDNATVYRDLAKAYYTIGRVDDEIEVRKRSVKALPLDRTPCLAE